MSIFDLVREMIRFVPMTGFYNGGNDETDEDERVMMGDIPSNLRFFRDL